ncbi:MAG: helix-turn-helix domain-containing protein, partial [Spirochaetes bacterium]|nr:helix-turn-helix domain-containing protein [Spirochaetota bacterium]
MGQKELIRGKTLEMVKQGKTTLKAAAQTLGVSYRQGIRLYAAYRQEGDAGLIHGNCGRPSNNSTDEAVLEAALEAFRERYSDFGPTFAAEKLLEEKGLKISVRVLRRLLIEAGEWKGRRRAREHRSRRERKERAGELVQFDGSQRTKVRHDWFEGRAPRCCLMTMIDDAGNTRLSRFFEAET